MLRDYQVAAIDALRQNIRDGVRRQVLQIPTGGGKTKVAAAMTELVKAKGKRVVFLADRIELVDQASARFYDEGIPHGIIQGTPDFRFKPHLPVQIATVQTLANRAHDPFDLVIVDECHSGGKRLNDWIVKQQQSVFIGLSATPWARGMGRVWEKLVRSVSTRELIDMGFLVDVVAWAPSEPDLTGVKVVAGEWDDKQLAAVCDQPTLVGDIVTTWVTKGENRQTIAFAVDVAHSKHIVEQFVAAGISAAHVDGYEDAHERKKTIDRFRASELKLICNVGILDKGFDVPEASCLIMARPIRSSLMLHIQQIGRVLRASPGKKDAVILDHAGNLVRHGFPTDALPDELDDGKRKEKAKPKPKDKEAKKCPKCAYVKPAGVRKCPACGFEPAPPNEVFHEPGELTKIMKTEDKRQLFAEIRFLQQQRGKSDGWAAHKMKDIAGVWPNAYRNVEPLPASQWTIDRVKHLDIKWAKSQAKTKPNPLAGWKEDALRA